MIKAYVADIEAFIENTTKREIFSGFIVRSIVSRALEKTYQDVFLETHEKRRPSIIYVSPIWDAEQRKIIEFIENNSTYGFNIVSLSVDVGEVVKEILSAGEYLLKDYRVEIISATLRGVKVRPIKVKEGSIIRVRFLSPTSFRMTPLRGKLKKSVYYPFPRPDIFVKSAIRTLRNSRDYERLAEDIFSSWDPKTIRLLRFTNFRTKSYYDFRNRPYIAFKGVFDYIISSSGPYNVLFALANVCGIGAWRSSGFGRVKIGVLGKDKIQGKG